MACATMILLLLLLALPAAIQAQDYQFQTNCDLGYGITITKYVGTGGTVSIPEKISGLPVTRIQSNAFFNCTSMTSVIIPKNINTIEQPAFQQCNNLTSITVDAQNSAYFCDDGILFDNNLSRVIKSVSSNHSASTHKYDWRMMIAFVGMAAWFVFFACRIARRGGSGRNNPGSYGTGMGRWRGPL